MNLSLKRFTLRLVLTLVQRVTMIGFKFMMGEVQIQVVLLADYVVRQNQVMLYPMEINYSSNGNPTSLKNIPVLEFRSVEGKVILFLKNMEVKQNNYKVKGIKFHSIILKH